MTINNVGDTESRCSFCAKTAQEIHLFEGPGGNICDECVGIFAAALPDTAPFPETPVPASALLPRTPRMIYEGLDDYVVGQDAAKRVLSIAVYKHFLRTQDVAVTQRDGKLKKANILLIGPTGSGKTFLAETLARVLGVLFVIADATTLTEAGYVGEDVESILAKLLRKCDYDATRARHGIVYIDEIDKIARRHLGSNVRDVSGEGVQQNLLKVIEGTIANVTLKELKKRTGEAVPSLEIDTTNILFICGGAFVGLDRVIGERMGESASIGFGAAITSSKERKDHCLLDHVSTTDLIRYGLIPEFVGRLPVIATLHGLDTAALQEIMTRPKDSIVREYHLLFAMHGIALEFEPGVLAALAEKAFKDPTGARALRANFEALLEEVTFELPDYKARNVGRVVVTRGMLDGSGKPKMVQLSPLATALKQ